MTAKFGSTRNNNKLGQSGKAIQSFLKQDIQSEPSRYFTHKIDSDLTAHADAVGYPPQVKEAAPTNIVVTQTSRLPTLQWFYNLSVRSKQFIGLFTAEVISIIGFVGVGSLLIMSEGQTQLINQAKSELAVNEVQYTLQMEQIGLGFRGQSDNTAITKAAWDYAQNRFVEPEITEAARQILGNETAARNLEYATLVGNDLHIIANANQNRAGEKFDPEGLVGAALTNSRQIQANAIVSWEELQHEGSPLPEGFANQDALIRYTVTPVRTPNTDEVIGALVAADIINHKLSIIESTLAALATGYSAVYLYKPNGEWVLAASLDKAKADQPIAINTPIADIAFLEKVVSARGEVITQRVNQSGRGYTMAAKALLNFNGDPVGVLVRGTLETELHQLFRRSLQLQLGVVVLAIVTGLIMARTLGRSISKPLRHLKAVTQRFAAGDSQTRAEVFAKDEVGQVAYAFNQLADSIVDSEIVLQEQTRHQANEAKQTRLLLEEVARSTVRHEHDLETVFNSALEGAREILGVDRVVIYRFLPDWSGYIAAESVGRDWSSSLNTKIEDTCIPEPLINAYRNNRVAPINDVFNAGFHPNHLKLMERFQVKANLVVPIMNEDELFGLLIAHHCAEVHEWKLDEVDFLRQLAVQLGVTLDRLVLLQEREADAERSQILKDITLLMTQAETVDSLLTQLPLAHVRQAIAVDRVIVYRFDQNWRGSIIAESVDPNWPRSLGAEIHDPCFEKEYVEKYRRGRVQAISNIYQAGLTQCHLKQLEPFAVKANLITPIRKGDNLMGLLIAHQCTNPRKWEQTDIDFFIQVANQVGVALDRYELLTQKETVAHQARLLATEQQRQKEMLQRQLIELLSDIEEASRGNLTVRADVTAGDVGTVADFFNAIIENLRQLVTQVKQSALQVNHALEQDEAAIRQLSDEVLNQAEETTRILNSVEQMTLSIQAVAESARQAAVVSQTAATTAETGGAAMERTVHNIANLRTMVGETSKKVKRLGESSQQISRVVALIEKIALQTNLLAINAGIEAARAGEEGQGFAVVAEEVGVLASQAAEATQDINRIVETIQLETAQVIEAMEKSTSQVVEGAHLVEDARESLDQILEVSHQIDELVQSISEATVSQTETSEAVVHLMKAITQVSEHTAEGSRKVAMSLRQTVEVSQELQTAVGTFKVK